jgi:hypothetical protein
MQQTTKGGLAMNIISLIILPLGGLIVVGIAFAIGWEIKRRGISADLASSVSTSENQVISKFSGHWIPIVVSLIFFVLACVFPALVFSNLLKDNEQIIAGWGALFFGPIAMYDGQFAWCANPLLLFSMVALSFRSWKITIFLSVLTLLMATNSLLLFRHPLFMGCDGCSGDSSNLYLLQYFHIGFYFWIASIMTIGIAAVVRMREQAQ